MSVIIDPGPIVFDNDAPLVFIGGPCVIENESHALRCAEDIKKITDEVGIGFVYKSSFDKANRTSVHSFRGVGIDEGLRILQKVRESIGVPVLSDVHTPQEATISGEVIDILQIPALLSRQTDLLLAAGATGKAVNVKKGQFMAPWDMKNAIEKVKSAGNDRALVTERGVSFGYNTLVADMASLYELARLGAPVIFDAGHSVQRPGGLGTKSGGNRDLIPTLSRAAVGAKVAGIFLEAHPDPDNAPCDGPNMWPIGDLKTLLVTLKEIDEIVKSK
ncbi:2-Keto-3-deoxy-D-manno-octulosonate-8-phosphate synthase [hydrothermal vent metagenome]|uniref:3-deoxy-8-phosphooctulonate synthase n=1 Tax=hydrothermal vent metagenome TaxID=652676 RepID=A0A3B1CF69_9ZZZZ